MQIKTESWTDNVLALDAAAASLPNFHPTNSVSMPLAIRRKTAFPTPVVASASEDPIASLISSIRFISVPLPASAFLTDFAVPRKMQHIAMIKSWRNIFVENFFLSSLLSSLFRGMNFSDWTKSREGCFISKSKVANPFLSGTDYEISSTNTWLIASFELSAAVSPSDVSKNGNGDKLSFVEGMRDTFLQPTARKVFRRSFLRQGKSPQRAEEKSKVFPFASHRRSWWTKPSNLLQTPRKLLITRRCGKFDLLRGKRFNSAALTPLPSN